MIERIAQETDATDLNNAVLKKADKKHSSSLYDVLGLTMTDESKSLKIVRNVAVGRCDRSTQVVGGDELQSGEKMADTVKRGAFLKGLAPIFFGCRNM